MRILVTSTAGLGHLLPVLTMATAATNAGHHVRVMTPLHRADRVEAQGLTWLELTEPPDQQRAEVRASSPDPEQTGVQIFGRLNPLAALPGVEAAIADWRPDLVLCEGGEFAGPLAAERAGFPVVRVHPSAAFDGFWERLVAPVLSRVRTELGLDADPHGERLLTVPQISYFPRAFDRGPESPWVTRVRRPRLPRPGGHREDLIYITFGSEIPAMPMYAETARAAVAAARATGCQMLLALGSADPAQLGDLSGVRGCALGRPDRGAAAGPSGDQSRRGGNDLGRPRCRNAEHRRALFRRSAGQRRAADRHSDRRRSAARSGARPPARARPG